MFRIVAKENNPNSGKFTIGKGDFYDYIKKSYSSSQQNGFIRVASVYSNRFFNYFNLTLLVMVLKLILLHLLMNVVRFIKGKKLFRKIGLKSNLIT